MRSEHRATDTSTYEKVYSLSIVRQKIDLEKARGKMTHARLLWFLTHIHPICKYIKNSCNGIIESSDGTDTSHHVERSNTRQRATSYGSNPHSTMSASTLQPGTIRTSYPTTRYTNIPIQSKNWRIAEIMTMANGLLDAIAAVKLNLSLGKRRHNSALTLPVHFTGGFTHRLFPLRLL